MKKIVITGLIFSMTATAMADQPQAHTWHNVNASNGVWHGQLQVINEKGSFVGPDGMTPISEFLISPDKPQKYGFDFDLRDDFDVAYTVTLTQKAASSDTNFTSKTCVFVVTAKGPADPDIQVASYNGAACSWKKVPGVGEDFFVA